MTLKTFTLAAVSALLLTAPPALAQKASDIMASHAWLRPTPAGGSMTAGYLVIANGSTKAVHLRSASSPMAQSVTLHRSVVTNGVARMEPLSEGLLISPGASAAFQPGGNHLMLDGVKAPLKVGDKATIILVFDGVGPVSVVFEVRKSAPADAMPAGMAMPPGMKMR